MTISPPTTRVLLSAANPIELTLISHPCLLTGNPELSSLSYPRLSKRLGKLSFFLADQKVSRSFQTGRSASSIWILDRKNLVNSAVNNLLMKNITKFLTSFCLLFKFRTDPPLFSIEQVEVSQFGAHKQQRDFVKVLAAFLENINYTLT